MGKQAGDYGDSDKMAASGMKPVVLLGLYFESRAKRLTGRLNVTAREGTESRILLSTAMEN